MTDKSTAVTSAAETKAVRMVIPPIVAQFQKMRDEGYNMLISSGTLLQNLPEHLNHAFEIVPISTARDLKEVFNTGSDSYPAWALTKTSVLKLASAAGIQIDPNLTKRVDDRKNRDYVAYQGVIWHTKPDGTRLCFKAEKELDLILIEEKVLDAKREKAARSDAKKWEKEPGWAEKQTRKEMIAIREHKVSLCETKAILRAIRGALGLKGSYTTEELAQPFVVVRVTYKLDYSDPRVQERVMDAALGSIGAVGRLYGQVGAEAAPAAAPPQEMINLESDDVDDDVDLTRFGVQDASSRPTIDVQSQAVHPPAVAKPVTPAEKPANMTTRPIAVTDLPTHCTDCDRVLNSEEMKAVNDGYMPQCSGCLDAEMIRQEGGR